MLHGECVGHFFEGVADAVGLFVGEVLVDGDAEDDGSEFLGDLWGVAVLGDFFEYWLLGEGLGVVDGGWDAFLIQRFAELVAGAGEGVEVHAAGVEVPGGVGASGWDRAEDARDVVDAACVDVGDGAAAVGFGSEGFEFAQADGSGDVVHAVVESDGFVEVLAGLAVGAEEAHVGGELFVIHSHHAALAGPEVFGCVEGVGACVAVGADALAVVLGKVCLGAVVDDFEVVLLGDCFDRVDVYGDAIQVSNGDGFGVWGDESFDVRGVGLVGVFEDIAELDLGACGDEHGDGGDEGPRGGDDLVASFEE